MKSDSPSSPAIPSDTLFLGAAWYPEQWDKAVHEEDMRLMRSLNMNVARVGEFAWSSLEPKEGKYQLGWLRDALDLAHANGIRIVMGTPTATPPGWLLKKHPEIGFQEADGYRHAHGARQHACYNNPIFRQHSRRITEVLAREFGQHPAVVAWQTDNELRGHQKVCICPACQASWTAWLEKRYGTIDELNRIWGTEVWSLHYESFADVPTMYRVCCWSHSFSLVLNYQRFMSDTAISFQDEQVKIIHAHSSQPVTHNTEDSVDEWDLFHGLDFAAADIYLGSFPPITGRMRLDAMRLLKPGRRFWTMETGCYNLGSFKAGQIACFNFLNYISGAQAVLYWCWRQHRTGMEINHAGVVYSNGQPSPGYDEAKRVGEARLKLEPLLRDYSPAPAEAALVRSESNARFIFTTGLEPNFSYRDKMLAQYQTLLEIGVWRDILSDQAPLKGYKVIFSPYLPYVTPEFLEQIQEHLNNGGAWVVGPYCGFRERDHTVPVDAIFGRVEKLLGFKTKFFSSTAPLDVVFSGGFQGKTRMYTTVFNPAPGDEVIGTHKGGAFDGQPWGVSRSFGKGRVYVLGSELDSPARALLYAGILDREKVGRTVLPLSVALCPQVTRDGRKAWAISNADEAPQEITLPAPGRDLLTGRAVPQKVTLPPCTNAFIAFE